MGKERLNFNTKFLLIYLLIIAIIPLASALTFQELSDNILNIFGTTGTNRVIGIIITLIIFAGLYDILELVGIFQTNWVKSVIAIGLGIIAVLIELPLQIATFGAGLASTFGAIGIALEIIIATLIFIGLVIGNTWAAKFAAKRHGQMAKIKAVRASGDVVGAIKGLREIQEEFKKK